LPHLGKGILINFVTIKNELSPMSKDRNQKFTATCFILMGNFGVLSSNFDLHFYII